MMVDRLMEVNLRNSCDVGSQLAILFGEVKVN